MDSVTIVRVIDAPYIPRNSGSGKPGQGAKPTRKQTGFRAMIFSDGQFRTVYAPTHDELLARLESSGVLDYCRVIDMTGSAR